MIPLPDFTVMGVVGFLGLGLGITLGDALFTVPMKQLEQGISRRS
tara:strand:+ start:298 stop:432 length:135 start_codon:yes stop_codon:yes gene_type:complete